MSALDPCELPTSQDLQSRRGTAPASHNYAPALDQKGRFPSQTGD